MASLLSLFKRSPSIRDIQNNEDDTEFFASLESDQKLAFFRSDQVHVGDLICQGLFHYIYEVTGLEEDRKQEEEEEEKPSTLTTEAERGNRRRMILMHPADESQYAIKTLKIHPQNSKKKKELYKAVKELINDAKYLSRLDHPNIVKLRGLTTDAYSCFLQGQLQDFFIITDRFNRQDTLAHRIHQWRLLSGARGSDPDEDLIPMKSNYAFQVAKALRHCHERGILYRGLEPKQIAFQDQHRILLTDFALARDFPPRNAVDQFQEYYHMTLAGTRRYMASELFVRGEYSLKSDVYTWAMVFYEMLTEHKPYYGLTAADHQKYVCEQGERPKLTNFYLPEAVDRILIAAWDTDVSERLTMEQVCDMMLNFLMKLDIHYYEQKEGDFLFDVDTQEESVSEWDEDEFLDEVGMLDDDSQSLSSFGNASYIPATSSTEDDRMPTSIKSLESSTRRTLASFESKPLKIISKAA